MSQEPQIRLAQTRDEDRATSLLLAQLAEHDLSVPEAHVRKSFRAMLDDPRRGFILVAELAQQVVGVAYVSFAEPLERDGTVAWLEELFVTPERRNNGIGDKLLQTVLEKTRAAGCVSVELEVTEEHVRASHLYHRAGFRPLGRSHWVLLSK